MKLLKLIIPVLLLLVVAVISMAFALVNQESVNFHLLFIESLEMQLGLGLAFTFLVGSILGGLIGTWPVFTKNSEIKKLQNELALQRQEVEKLRGSKFS